ncbi:hypothetical protein [Gallaecimonas xiamenensis]|uniref:DNA repair ATPase n=1 Tax=Gallaecimonas xiamenensis 3-C-1 TaxID=745411 RepID=K2JY53_9GAMM|nr:hypothetical protein [Gallaecimonas xiamenensis]EKE75224.1 hypothetical protein B3C1_08106 [Gallaecimonas xiamenensis 3-C-1]
MTPYIVGAVVVILLVVMVAINMMQQQKQKQEAARRQEVAKCRAIIDETETLLPIAGQMPISSTLVAMLHRRHAEALAHLYRLTSDAKIKSRAEDAHGQYLKAHKTKRPGDDNIRLPDNEQQMVQLLQAIKLLIAVARTEFNKGKVDAETFRLESAFLDRIRLKINIEGLITRGVSAKSVKQLGSARQFLNKAKQLAAGHAHQDPYLRTKVLQIQAHLDEINGKGPAVAANGTPTPGAPEAPKAQAKPKPKTGAQQLDDIDLIFSPKKKW